MRPLGYVFAPLAALSWLAAIAAAIVIYLVPQAQEVAVLGQPLPTLLLQFGNIGGIVLVVLNGLSGRWAPESLRHIDLWASRLGFYGISAIFITVIVIGYRRDVLEADALWKLVSLTAFAAYDYFANQGEENRSSTLKADEARRASMGLQPGRASGAPDDGGRDLLDPLHKRGLMRFMLPAGYKVAVEVRAGGFDFDIVGLSETLLFGHASAALAEQQGMTPVAQPAPPAPPA